MRSPTPTSFELIVFKSISTQFFIKESLYISLKFGKGSHPNGPQNYLIHRLSLFQNDDRDITQSNELRLTLSARLTRIDFGIGPGFSVGPLGTGPGAECHVQVQILNK